MFSGGMLERLFMGTTLGDFGWHAFTVKLLSYCYFGVFIKHSFTVFIVSPGMVIVDSMCYFCYLGLLLLSFVMIIIIVIY